MTIAESQHDIEENRNETKDTNLLVSELDQTGLILNNLVLLVLAILEQLGQRKPLARHLVPVVRIDELIVVHAIRRIPPHLLDGGLAAVEVDNVVDESLALFREGKGLGWVGGVVF